MAYCFDQKFPDLTILKALQPGGQKEVFVVNYPPYGKCVLKIVTSDKIDRVIREIKIVTEHSIDNVPEIFETGEFIERGETYLYIFEEYIEGCSLKERLKTGKLSFLESVRLLENLLSTVRQLETINVVHRDIKPDNILIGMTGDFFLIDFGIARALDMQSLTMTNVGFGPHTPGYGAPELFQYSKNKISSRADLFSVGVVVFEAVTGAHPFLTGGEVDCQEIWYRTMTIFPNQLQIEGDTQQMFMGLVNTLMQKQISKRPRSAAKAYEWFLAAQDTFIFGGEK